MGIRVPAMQASPPATFGVWTIPGITYEIITDYNTIMSKKDDYRSELRRLHDKENLKKNRLLRMDKEWVVRM